MYDLIQLTDKCYYIDSYAKAGLVRLNYTDVCIIDSGNDKSAGRKICQHLNKNGWNLTAIYNTHSNADHIGGNRYLQSHTGCKVYAKGIEQAFTKYPLLEPSFVYGAYPPKDLRHKFMLAEASEADILTSEVLAEGMEMIDLPGHFFDMAGFRIDNVVYLGDCLSSRETLNKYGICFIYDVGAYIETLEKVKEIKADIFVPAHAEITDDIVPLAQFNIDKVYEIADKIINLCNKPVYFEKILQRLFADYGLDMTFEQYALVGSTVRSHLAWLRNTGKVDVIFEDNMLLWKRI